MKVEIYKVIKITAGGFHSWVKSNVGIIRKPNNKILLHFEPTKEKVEEKPQTKSWLQRFWEFVKKVIHRETP